MLMLKEDTKVMIITTEKMIISEEKMTTEEMMKNG